MAGIFRNAAFAAVLAARMLSPAIAQADQPGGSPGGASPEDRMRAEFDQLSPAARAALLKQIDSANPNTSREQAESAFNHLPPGLQAELRAKWGSLSDQQKAALKKMGPTAIKEMIVQKLKQLSPEIQDAVRKVKDFVHKLTG
jgi:hypothetical protein